MPIKQLTDEQVRTWTREQKDRWWLENVFRGNMPQLTIRSAITGFLLGMIVQQLTGLTLAQVLALRVFGPLGLAQTSYPYVVPLPPSRRASSAAFT